MPNEVVWTNGAEEDLRWVYKWLEDTTEGSGDRFVHALDGGLSLVRDFPEIAAVYDWPIRRLVIKGGRFGMFYVSEPRGIIVIAVQDLRQDPEFIARILSRRMPG